MTLRCMLLFAGALLIGQQAVAGPIEWESLARRDDYEFSWARNIQNRKGGHVATETRMMFDHADQAPNNARFNNIRFYISIDCHAMRYLLLQKDYYNGERRVYSEYLGGSLSNKGDTREVKGTYQQTIAERTCPSQGLS